MTDVSEEIKSLFIGLVVIAAIFQYNHPKTEYEVNGELLLLKQNASKSHKVLVTKNLKKLRLLTQETPAKSYTCCMTSMESRLNQSELDKCVVMNEEISSAVQDLLEEVMQLQSAYQNTIFSLIACIRLCFCRVAIF